MKFASIFFTATAVYIQDSSNMDYLADIAVSNLLRC